MKTFEKRIVSFAVLLLLCVTAVFGNGNMAKAKETEKYVTVLEETGNAAADTEISYNFSVDLNKEIDFLLLAPQAVYGEIAITDKAGNLYDGGTMKTSDWEWDDEYGCYFFGFYEEAMPAGDYVISFTVATPVQYILYVDQVNPQAALSQTKLTLTAGMKQQLTVDNYEGKIKWKSNKKSVAVVGKKGLVTAKKAGSATITATTEDGIVLKCKVTVKANEMTRTKYTQKDVAAAGKDSALQVYNAAYDSKGNLVLKCRFVSNFYTTIVGLEDIDIELYTSGNKLIASYTADSYKLNVARGGTKDFTVTIPASKLKVKNADLRNAYYTSEWLFLYY